MKKTSLRTMIVAMSTVCGLLIGLAGPTLAEITDLTDVPLGNQNSTPVLPNIMYILDDSLSMTWDHMPDNVDRMAAGGTQQNCKTASGKTATLASRTCSDASPSSQWGDPPYYAAKFNQIYYNPDIEYTPGVDSTGKTLGQIDPKKAIDDAYLATGVAVKDLTTTYHETYYCTVAGLAAITAAKKIAASNSPPTVADLTSILTDKSQCRRNGIDNVGSGGTATPYFLFWSNVASAAAPPTTGPLGAYPVATGTVTSTFSEQFFIDNAPPFFYNITPHEYCSDVNLVNCQLANANGSAPSGFNIPAPLRYCSSTANASSTAVMSDPVGTAAPKCTKKFDTSTYQYPRYGRFSRVDIVPGTTTYPKSTTAIRHDCLSATSCTYAEELQNFANWYSYYRNRLLMMKTATGHAFLPVTDRYRVGFITINPNNPVTPYVVGGSAKTNAGAKFLPLNKFDAAQRSNWYTILYGQDQNGSTPLREALARVGRYYGGMTDAINKGMSPDPVQYSCQQNFALLTTDGYWNSSPSVQLDGTTLVGNQDNVPDGLSPPFVDRATTGTLDSTGASTITGTPSITTEQVVCSGSNTTTFGNTSGAQTNCGCGSVTVAGITVGKTAIMQRVTTTITGTPIVEGVPAAKPVPVSVSSFSTITSCTTPLVVSSTIPTPATTTEDLLCTKSSNKQKFSDGTSVSCSCKSGSNTNIIIRQTKTSPATTFTVDGVAQAGTPTSTLTVTANGSSFNPYTGNDSCGSSSLAVTLSPNPKTVAASGVPVTGSNAGGGGTTLAVALTPNPQTKAGTPNTTISTAGGTPDTLADVAMYYYKTDLRTSGPLAVNNVPQSGADFTNTQHMTTFTLGLGLQGNMDYQADYPSNPASDFAKIKSAAKGCTFSGAGTCDWPAPVSGTPSTLDDLWHAAVNGRGLYFSASDPNSLAAGLSGALAAIDQQTGAAAASATSSQTLTSTSNLVFASTFRTVKWDGEITAQHLDPATGGIQQVKDPVTGLLVASPLVWSADAQLDAQVAATSDTRKIYMFTGAPTFPTKLKDFTFANMSTVSVVGGLSAQNSFFINQCVAMSQCPSLTSAGANVSGGAGATTGQHGDANDGNLLVNYLRGQKSMETAGIFRIRDHALGDPVDSKPVYVQGSIFGFTDNVSPPYSDFQKINNSASTPRQAALYVGANDGMLHALNADTGSEMWAYVPRMVFPQLSKIASFNWSVQHTYSVDGSPEIMDIYDPTAGAWKTILVSGLNKGGRGYFALDVTDPKNPKGLWEICSDSAVCRIAEPNMGYSYGNPVITTRSLDGGFTTQPVVIFTSGYNNVSPGDGGGWLFVVDAFTGKVLERVPTSAGTTTTPSGLAKVAAFAENFFTKNLTTFVYGGDLLGNLWRFDMSVSPPTTLLMTSFKDAKGNPQSITTRPELGVISKNRYIFVGTGRYLGPSDLGDPSLLVPPEQWAYQNSLYAVKDTGANITNPRSTFIQQTLIDSGGITRTTSNNNVNPGTDSWFIDFNPGNTSPGERVDTDPTLVLGTLVLHTNIPNNNACSTGGDFFTYFFNFATGTYVSTSTNNVAGTRTYGSLVVGSNVVRTSTGAIISLDTTDQGKLKPSQAPIGGVPGSGRRVSWRELLK